MRKTKRRTGQVNLRQALAAESGRLAELFALWDADGDGSINRKEFSRALKMMGLRVNKDDFNAFCKLCDADNSGTLDLDELQTLLASTVRPGSPLPQKPRSWPMALTLTIYNTLQTTAVQAILYLAVVVIFQTLTDTLRLKEEIHLDLRFGQSFLSNPFDAQLNTFPRIRRIGDVYEWGNQVLWPGLFGDTGPGCGDVGPPGHFVSWSTDPLAANSSVGAKGGCNDAAWPDGVGGIMRAG